MQIPIWSASCFFEQTTASRSRQPTPVRTAHQTEVAPRDGLPSRDREESQLEKSRRRRRRKSSLQGLRGEISSSYDQRQGQRSQSDVIRSLHYTWRVGHICLVIK